MKNKIYTGMLFGVIAGTLDVIPMVMQNLSWDANISAFSMWVISGFMISTSELKMNSILKGILISFLMLAPCAVLIGWRSPASLLPISIMTLILGSLLGYSIERFNRRIQ